METMVIINLVLMTLLGIGFLSYLIWLGFKSIKLSGEIRNMDLDYNSKFNNFERLIKEELNELRRDLDKMDSRFDLKIKGLENHISSKIEIISTDLHQRCQKIENRLQQAISDLVEDVDKLKK